ncbi:MAG: PA14 domain-containing protein [Candidatus Promineifilaceae bacterium]
MGSDVDSEDKQGSRTGVLHGSLIALAGLLLLAALACRPSSLISRGDSEEQADGLPTLMSTAGAPDVDATDDSADGDGEESGTPTPDKTSEAELAATYTPSTSGLAPTYTPVSWPITPTATITGSEVTATSIAQTATAAATLTPRPTATRTSTPRPIPTSTRYIPPPPPTNTPIPIPIFTATPTSVPSSNRWAGQYFANQNLSGAATVIRNDANIQFNWGTGSPFPGPIPNDHFSVRWSRSLNFAAGTYTFSAASDDGVRVYLDNQLIINQWTDAQSTVFTAQRTLSAGNHSLRVEYYENTGDANIQFWWELSGTTSSAWKGEYFANQNLSGSPTYIRNDQEIFFNWGQGSPGAGIPNDHFSIRWTREAGFNAGTYRFFVHPDDGVRVWLDGEQIIDNWQDATNEIYTAVRTLSAGDSHPARRIL